MRVHCHIFAYKWRIHNSLMLAKPKILPRHESLWKLYTSTKIEPVFVFFATNFHHQYHTTKITVTFVISHFDIVWYYKKTQSLWNITFFWLYDNTKYHIFKLVTLRKLNYLYNITPSKYILLMIFIWRLIEIYFSTFYTLWIFLIKKYNEWVA